jgi:hypothetical protein
MSEYPEIAYLERPYELFDAPLPWQEAGLQQTASGYGRKLTSHRCVRLPDGRVRRVYVTCFSNSGSCWITLDKRVLFLRD